MLESVPLEAWLRKRAGYHSGRPQAMRTFLTASSLNGGALVEAMLDRSSERRDRRRRIRPTRGPVILVILPPPAADYATRSTSTLTPAISGTSAMFITVSVPLGTQ
jgi:hypothetical protein